MILMEFQPICIPRYWPLCHGNQHSDFVTCSFHFVVNSLAANTARFWSLRNGDVSHGCRDSFSALLHRLMSIPCSSLQNQQSVLVEILMMVNFLTVVMTYSRLCSANYVICSHCRTLGAFLQYIILYCPCGKTFWQQEEHSETSNVT